MGMLSKIAARFAAKPTPARPDAATLSRDHFSDEWMTYLTQTSEIDETLRLAGVQRHQLRRLTADDEISAALETRRAAVMSTPWRIDGYNESPPMQHLNDTITAHWERIVCGVWDAVPMGFSVMEAVWAQTGARVDLQRIGLVPLEYFNPRTDGTLLASLPGQGSELPVDNTFKFFETVRDQSFDAPHGRAVLASLYWPWHFRQNGWRYWMQFVERFGSPIVTGRVINPSAFVDAMAGLGINTAIGVGPSDDVSVVTQGLAGEFERLEIALNKRIQKVILGQTLTTDVSGSGSYAASKTHDLVRMDRRASDQRIVARTLQRIVNAFWMLNRYPGEAPKIYMEDSKGLEQDRAARDAELVKAGILKLTDQYLLTHYDYEPGDIAPPDQKTQAAPLPQAGLSALMSAGRASAIKFTPGQQLIEELADHAMSQAPALLTTDQIRKAIAKATSPGHLADLLADMAPKASTAEFSAVMERALFAADVAGYHNAETGRF